MEDHTQLSWKEDITLAQLNNSVNNVTEAIGAALTNPKDQTLRHAQDMIDHADRAFAQALKNRGEWEPILSLQELYDQQKAQLNKLH